MTTRADTARSILGIPLFNELMDGLEQSAVDRAVHASPTDHEARQAHLAQVRAIRDLRYRIEQLAKENEEKKPARKGFA